MLNASLLGTGACTGGRALPSAEIDTRLGKPAGWLEGASGVISRPVIAEGETQESLAVAAARLALADARLDAGDIDLLLFASAVGRQPIPSTATLIKRELGLSQCASPAFDINATCLSAVAAMEVAALYIAAGRARHVLIVASEIASRALPWADDPATAALFGDGAAALVLGPAQTGGLHLRDVSLETWAEGYDYCALPAGGTRYDLHTNREAFEQNAFFRMDGHALFKLTRTKLPRFIERLLDRAGWRQEEVDLVIPHQASPLALEHMIRKCGFARDRVVSTVQQTGNLVAASIPMTLDTARRKGRITPGSKVLLIGTSAGVSIGGATLEA
ncbi:MAG: 3-oxoacyl-ACP synthase III family protein [Hyphomonas sp.]